MPTFRLLVGTHVHRGKVYEAGDLVQCTEEEARLFRTVFADKFEEEAAAAVASTSPLAEEPETAGSSVSNSSRRLTRSKLQEMNLQQLRALAEEEEVSLEGLERKADIVEAIADALGL